MDNNFWNIIFGKKPDIELNEGTDNRQFLDNALPREGEKLRLFMAAYDTSEDVSDLAQFGVDVQPMRLHIESDVHDDQQVLVLLMSALEQAGRKQLAEDRNCALARLALMPMSILKEIDIQSAAEDK